MVESSQSLKLQINGKTRQICVPSHWTLLEVLRYELDLIATKQGCDKGDCGACTVLIDGSPQLACLTLAGCAEGCSIETAEGLKVQGQQSDALDRALVQHMDQQTAAQCGFCTPGILLSAKVLLRAERRPLEAQTVREALAGNLCRCTGYTKIIAAIEAASLELFGAQESEGG